MEKVLRCPVCGRHFTTDEPKRKYCGPICQEAGQRMQRKSKHSGAGKHEDRNAYTRPARV